MNQTRTKSRYRRRTVDSLWVSVYLERRGVGSQFTGDGTGSGLYSGWVSGDGVGYGAEGYRGLRVRASLYLDPEDP